MRALGVRWALIAPLVYACGARSRAVRSCGLVFFGYDEDSSAPRTGGGGGSVLSIGRSGGDASCTGGRTWLPFGGYVRVRSRSKLLVFCHDRDNLVHIEVRGSGSPLGSHSLLG